MDKFCKCQYNKGHKDGYVEGYYEGYCKAVREFIKYLTNKSSIYSVEDYDWGWFSFNGINVEYLGDFADDFIHNFISDFEDKCDEVYEL